MITFEWDATKASINNKKHGISFDEAKTVFFDENAKIIHDPDHSTPHAEKAAQIGHKLSDYV